MGFRLSHRRRIGDPLVIEVAQSCWAHDGFYLIARSPPVTAQGCCIYFSVFSSSVNASTRSDLIVRCAASSSSVYRSNTRS